MKKYLVRAEVLVTSCDFVTYEVEAASEDEAKQKAIDLYEDGTEPIDRWASDFSESELDKQHINDWEIEKLINLIEQANKANKILFETSIRAIIIQTSEYFTDYDEDDECYGKPIYEGYLEDDWGNELYDTRTGRYCDIDSVKEELEGLCKLIC